MGSIGCCFHYCGGRDGFRFIQKIIQKSENLIGNSTIQMLEKNSEKISSKLYNIQSGGELLARLLEKGGLESPQQIRQYLEIFSTTEEICQAVYVEKEAVVAEFGGKAGDLNKRPYYRTLAEIEDSSAFCIEDEQIAEGQILLFSILVFDQESARRGMILLFYPLNELKPLINMSYESYSPTASALLDSDGNILLCTDKGNPFFSGENLFDNVTEKNRPEVLLFQNRMRGQGAGRVNLSAEGQDGVIFHTPVGKEWILAAEYELSNISRRERLIWNDAWQMVLWGTGVVLLLVIIYIFSNIIDKIRNVGENKALVEKADTDLLTGLNNKIATERKIKEYMKENPDDLAMMLIFDIDNFKKINDTMGHAFGDEVLRTLGKHIGENFRVTDIIGRTGGDEFTIFLKSLKDDTNTLREAQKLVDFFREFEAGEYVKYSATASIGAAVFPKDGETFEVLYKAADQALYKAKERGKNQLAFYDDRDRK